MSFRDLFELETVADAGLGDGGAGSPSDGGGGDGGGAGAGADAGAAVAAAPVDGGASDGAAAPPAPFNFQEWAATPEGREQLGSTFHSWSEQQAAEQAAQEAAAARAAENPYSDIEEGLGLLGIDPAKFKEYIGVQNAPLMSVAERIQTQEAVAWVDQQLNGLGAQHPDLLGDGIDKLAELVNDDGEPLFDPQEVRGVNRNAVLYAASALQNASLDASGQPTLAHDVALAEAAKQVAARDEVMMKIGIQRYIADLENRSNAPRDLSGGGAGASQPTGLEGGDEISVARRFMAERANQ